MVAYSAVVIDNDSRNELLNHFSSIIPDGWEIIAHHMTINLGEIDPEFEKYLGFKVTLNVEDIAFDDKVIAVGVSGFKSKNKKPHITLAVNRSNGGKPVMSNYLTNWKQISFGLKLNGVVTEVKSK